MLGPGYAPTIVTNCPTLIKQRLLVSSKLDRRRGRGFKIQQYREIKEMVEEIYLADGIGYEYRVKYLDENRVIVQTVSRYTIGDGSETEYINYSMPAKVRLHQIDSWPYTEELKTQILEYHRTAAE